MTNGQWNNTENKTKILNHYFNLFFSIKINLESILIDEDTFPVISPVVLPDQHS